MDAIDGALMIEEEGGMLEGVRRAKGRGRGGHGKEGEAGKEQEARQDAGKGKTHQVQGKIRAI